MQFKERRVRLAVHESCARRRPKTTGMKIVVMPSLFRRRCDNRPGRTPMDDKKPKVKSEADAELERSILAERKFTLEEAIGRMAGPGCMKGASPITRHEQAAAEIQEYLGKRLTDSAGALCTVLLRQVRESEMLLADLDRPFVVLDAWVRRVLDSEYRLKDLVREVDMEWGRSFGERPLFEVEGRSPSPDDPYTIDSVRKALVQLLELLAAPTK